jgi:RNA polymerase sigma factor (sigma-70 family)
LDDRLLFFHFFPIWPLAIGAGCVSGSSSRLRFGIGESSPRKGDQMMLQSLFDSRTTRTFLLRRLDVENDQETWRAFDARYRPLLRSFFQRLGLGVDGAEEAAQETLVEFLSAYRAGRYDRSKGRLRSWLYGIARYRLSDLRRRHRVARCERGTSAVIQQIDVKSLEDAWDDTSRRTALRAAFERLRASSRVAPDTLRAFELYALCGHPPAEVATSLGMSLQAVYLSKHRCLAKLREELAHVAEEYELE